MICLDMVTLVGIVEQDARDVVTHESVALHENAHLFHEDDQATRHRDLVDHVERQNDQ